MKPIALLLVAFALAATSAFAEPYNMKVRRLAMIPETATVHYARAARRLTTGGRRHVAQLARALSAGTLEPARIEGSVKGTCGDDLGAGCGGLDIEELIIIVLMEAVQDSNNDLKDQMQESEARMNAKQRLRAEIGKEQRLQFQLNAEAINSGAVQINANLDSLNEQSETQSLELQMTMDWRSKLIDTLSNVLKKISNTGDTVIQNMK